MREIKIDLDDPNLSDEDRVIKPGITYKRKLSPDSNMGKMLKQMLLRQQLLQQFHSCKITLEELNQKLFEGGIDMTYQVGKGFIHSTENTLV